MTAWPHRIDHRLDRAARLAGTGLSFALFGLGAILLSLLVFAPLNLLVDDPARRSDLAQGIVHRTFRLFVHTMIALRVIDVEVDGAAALYGDHGRLVIANHPSLIDVVLIMSLMRRTQCVVKHENWKNPFMRGVLVATGYLRNDDDPEKLINACANILRADHNLLIFPEGSRTVPGRPRKLHRGFANIAVTAGAPIRLVTIRCAPTHLTKGQKWYDIPPCRPHYAVEVHELIEVDELVNGLPPSVAVRRLTRHVDQRFEEILADG
jgi:1-acyl-sn-glycerol-3-phosphate acyltransferase